MKCFEVLLLQKSKTPCAQTIAPVHRTIGNIPRHAMVAKTPSAQRIAARHRMIGNIEEAEEEEVEEEEEEEEEEEKEEE